MDLVRHFFERDGQRLVVYQATPTVPSLGPAGDGPPHIVFLLHSNGFHFMCHLPMIEAILGVGTSSGSSSGGPLSGIGISEVYGLDLRGHGLSSPLEPRRRLGYDDHAADITAALALVRSLAGPRAVVHGFGHSLGGTGMLLTEVLHPGSFASIYAYEPNVAGPTFQRVLEAASRAGGAPSPLEVAARSRRNDFASIQDAKAELQRRNPYKHLDPACLDLYVRFGLEARPGPAGQGVALRCDPSVEADIFKTVSSQVQLGVFDRLAELRCPVTIARGRINEGAHGILARTAVEVAARVPGARHVELARLLHMGPLEDPREVGGSFAEHLRALPVLGRPAGAAGVNRL